MDKHPANIMSTMKAIDNGCFYSVRVSRQGVSDFKDRWPCSTLPDRSVWFQFDKRNGDLVDMHPSDMDGSDVLALSQDAQAYGKQILKLA